MSETGSVSLSPDSERRIRSAVTSIAGVDRFPTVSGIHVEAERLGAQYPAVSTEVVGESRAGLPIHRVRVGLGERHVVVIGMPHPNEPIGGLACLRLAELVAEPFGSWADYTWHIIPCADPDGAVLNEGWFGGPFTRSTYALNVYRPPFEEQFEWTFRREDLTEPGLPSTPESRAVMSIIDEVRPAVLATLYNGETGGFYTYVTDPVDALADIGRMARTLSGIPIERGVVELEGPLMADGVFLVAPNLTGGRFLCSTDYAARHGTVGLTVEPPLWVDPRAADESPATIGVGEADHRIAVARAAMRDWHEGCLEVLSAEVDLDTPLGRAVQSDAELLAEDWVASEDSEDAGSTATVAYVTSLESWLELERVRTAGHVVRVLASVPEPSQAVRRTLEDSRGRLAEWAGAADAKELQFVGLDEAVKCHLTATLAAVEAVAQPPR